MPQLTIYRKGLLLIAIPLLAQLAFTWMVAQVQESGRVAQERSLHSKDVLQQAQVVLSSLLDAETGARGYVFTGDMAFAQPYFDGITTTPQAMTELQTLVSDNPAQVTLADGLAKKVRTQLDWHTRMVEIAEDGDRAKAMELIRGGEGKRQMDVIRKELSRFLDEEERLESERAASLTLLQGRQRNLLVGGSIGAFLLTATLAAVFSRGISGRLNLLTDNADRLGRGQPLMGATTGTDEIATLDRAFRRMAEDLQQSTQALRQSIEEVHDLYNRAPCGYHSLDKDGLIVTVNDTELEWLGYRRDEVEGRMRFVDFLPPEGRALFCQRYEKFKAEGSASNLEFELIRHDGSRLPVLLNASAIVDAQGSYIASRSTLFDITERKVLETQLQELNQQLEKRVQERTSDLADANRELVHKNQENEMFVYSVSHDLRSPLVNLQGFSKELALSCRELKVLLSDERIPPELHRKGLTIVDSDMAESIRFIQTGVMRLSSIIDALLRLSRAGRIEYHFEQVDMQAMVHRIVDSLGGTIQQKAAEVIQHPLPVVRADPSSIEQVFANLISNALNYVDPSRPGRIEIGCLPSDPATPGRTFYVRDNGLGIPKGSLEKVFQAFQRMHPTAAPGEGMGLAIVRRVVDRHQGRVWVESDAGIGSTFYVTLGSPVSSAVGLASVSAN